MLKDVISESARKKLYAFVTLAAIGFGAWQGADGDWEAFTASVIAALTTALATANTGEKFNDNGAVNLSPLVTALLCVALVLLILWLVGHPVKVG